MDEDLLERLKVDFRALALSSPTRIDAMSLLRDYRNMVGSTVPMRKFGYSDPVKFLREMFDDCFVFQGSPTNPDLTLIVPETLQHLDNFVRNQKIAPSLKHKGKRRSVPEHQMTPAQHNIASTFVKKNNAPHQAPVAKEAKTHQYTPEPPSRPPCTNSSNAQGKDSDKDILKRDTSNYARQDSLKKSAFLQSRYAENQCADNQSGPLTQCSSSSKKPALEELKREISEIIAEHPKGVWCIDLLDLYKERHARELNFMRFGYTSLVGLASEADGVLRLHYPERGDYLLINRAHAAAHPPPAPRPRPRRESRPSTPVDPEDALPGFPYVPEVFSEECMGPLDSIPAASLGGVRLRESLPVTVGEVYSPSHFWLLRLGTDHYSALDHIMNEMNSYYESAEGRARRLLPRDVRVGQYCSACYEGDWHRSLIVKIIDSTTVKVRHVDYGTVERCAAGALRALLRRWGALPAQALRARMAAVRPAAAARRWPRPASERFLELVRDRQLIAVVAALDLQDDIMEVYLVNTATEVDVCIGDEMISEGHADPAVVGSAIATSECYLFPQFAPLESGDALNYCEVNDCLRAGVALDCVEEYRRYVPPAEREAPPSDPAESPPLPSSKEVGSSPRSDDRVPPVAPCAASAPPPSLVALTPPPTPPPRPAPPGPVLRPLTLQQAMKMSMTRSIERMSAMLLSMDAATALIVATAAEAAVLQAVRASRAIDPHATEPPGFNISE